MQLVGEYRNANYRQSINTLRSWDVNVLYDVERYPLRNDVPWDVVLDTLHELIEVK